MNEHLKATLGLDNGPFARGLRGAKGMAHDFGGFLKDNIGKLSTTAAVAAIAKLTMEGVNAARQIGEVSRQTSLSSDAVQTFTGRMADLGVTQSQSAAGLQKFTEKLGDAGLKGGEAGKMFSDLGVSIADSTGKMRPTEQVFRDTISALAAMKDPAQRAKLANELLGDSGRYVAEAFKDGSKSMDAYSKSLEAAGKMFSKDEIKNVLVWTRTIDAGLRTAQIRLAKVANQIATLDWRGLMMNFKGGGAGFDFFAKDLSAAYQDALEGVLTTTGQQTAAEMSLAKITEARVESEKQIAALKKEQAAIDEQAFAEAERRTGLVTEAGKFKTIDDLLGKAREQRDAGTLTPELQQDARRALLAQGYQAESERMRGIDPARSSALFNMAEVVKSRINSLQTAAKQFGNNPLNADNISPQRPKPQGFTESDWENWGSGIKVSEVIQRTASASDETLKHNAIRTEAFLKAIHEAQKATNEKLSSGLIVIPKNAP